MSTIEACTIICGGNTGRICEYSGPVREKPSEARLIDCFTSSQDGPVNVFACEGMRPWNARISKIIQRGCSGFKPLPSPVKP